MTTPNSREQKNMELALKYANEILDEHDGRSLPEIRGMGQDVIDDVLDAWSKIIFTALQAATEELATHNGVVAQDAADMDDENETLLELYNALKAKADALASALEAYLGMGFFNNAFPAAKAALKAYREGKP